MAGKVIRDWLGSAIIGVDRCEAVGGSLEGRRRFRGRHCANRPHLVVMAVQPDQPVLRRVAQALVLARHRIAGCHAIRLGRGAAVRECRARGLAKGLRSCRQGEGCSCAGGEPQPHAGTAGWTAAASVRA
jgi:hypothetical protein